MARRQNLSMMSAYADDYKRQILRGLGLEAEEVGTQAEIEYVVYARITDFGILHQAISSEAQEQWEIKIPGLSTNGGGGRIRVRKTADKNGITYALTIKVRKTPQEQDGLVTPQVDLSHAVTCDDQTLQTFKILAESGMIKERFCFPTDHGLQWEVDVFLKEDGTRHEWVKIDLELKKGMPPLQELPKLPPGFAEAILSQHGARTTEEEQKIETLYRTVFLRPNPFAKDAAEMNQQDTEDDLNKVTNGLLED